MGKEGGDGTRVAQGRPESRPRPGGDGQHWGSIVGEADRRLQRSVQSEPSVPVEQACPRLNDTWDDDQPWVVFGEPASGDEGLWIERPTDGTGPLVGVDPVSVGDKERRVAPNPG